MNNQTFNFHRFSMLFRRDFSINKKNLLVQATDFTAGILLIMIIKILNKNLLSGPEHYNDLYGWFMFFLFGGAILLASTLGNDINTKNNRINTLMLPASMLEKYMVQWIKIVILCPIAIYIFWLIANTLAILGDNAFSPDPTLYYLTIPKIIRFYGADSSDIFYFSLLYLTCQSLFIVGAAFWPRFSTLKSLLAMWIITFVEGIILWTICRIKISGFQPGETFDTNIFNENVIAMILVCLILFNWILPYYRFKETDVVQRV